MVPVAVGENIVLQRKPAETMTPGGIVIPGAEKFIPTRGIVTSTGCEVYDVEEGDDVIFQAFNAAEIKLEDGQEYVIINQSSILCKIKPSIEELVKEEDEDEED